MTFIDIYPSLQKLREADHDSFHSDARKYLEYIQHLCTRPGLALPVIV
jgi:hypothetical protein